MANTMALIRALRKRLPKPIELPTKSMMNTTIAAMSTGSNQAYCAGKSIARLPAFSGRSEASRRNDDRPSPRRDVGRHRSASADFGIRQRTVVDPCRDDEFIKVMPTVLSISDEMIEWRYAMRVRPKMA